MIKKFKNGNILLSIKKELKEKYYDSENIYLFYYDEMFINDLTIETLDNDYYLIDKNTLQAYELNYNVYSNILNCFLDDMQKKENIKLNKLPKKYNDYVINLYINNVA